MPRPAHRRGDWPARVAALGLVLAGLLQIVTWLGAGQGAFMLLDAIHGHFFRLSYGAHHWPVIAAGLLILAAGFTLFRHWLTVPAVLAALAAVTVADTLSGRIGFLHPLIHPLQLFPRASLGLAALGGLAALLLATRRRASPVSGN